MKGKQEVMDSTGSTRPPEKMKQESTLPKKEALNSDNNSNNIKKNGNENKAEENSTKDKIPISAPDEADDNICEENKQKSPYDGHINGEGKEEEQIQQQQQQKSASIETGTPDEAVATTREDKHLPPGDANEKGNEAKRMEQHQRKPTNSATSAQDEDVATTCEEEEVLDDNITNVKEGQLKRKQQSQQKATTTTSTTSTSDANEVATCKKEDEELNDSHTNKDAEEEQTNQQQSVSSVAVQEEKEEHARQKPDATATKGSLQHDAPGRKERGKSPIETTRNEFPSDTDDSIEILEVRPAIIPAKYSEEQHVGKRAQSWQSRPDWILTDKVANEQLEKINLQQQFINSPGKGTRESVAKEIAAHKKAIMTAVEEHQMNTVIADSEKQAREFAAGVRKRDRMIKQELLASDNNKSEKQRKRRQHYQDDHWQQRMNDTTMPSNKKRVRVSVTEVNHGKDGRREESHWAKAKDKGDAKEDESLEKVRLQVISAASLVARSLCTGPWFSLCSSLGLDDTTNCSPNQPVPPNQPVRACSALHQFTLDVILPSMKLQYGNKHNYKGEQLAIQDSRIFLSTLLILREVMAQNAEAIFGLSAFNTASDQSENDGHHHSVSQLSASVLASSIILTGLDTLGGEFAGRLAEKFLGMMDDYDNGHACFRDSLPIANQTAEAVVPSKKGGATTKLNSAQRMAWQISFNHQRKQHPLFRHHGQKKRDYSAAFNRPDDVPEPNMVHMSITEETGDY